MLYEQLSEDINAIRITVLTRKLGPKETEELNVLATDLHRWRLRNEALRNCVQRRAKHDTEPSAPTSTLESLAAQVADLSKGAASSNQGLMQEHAAIAALNKQVANINGTLTDLHDDMVDVRGAMDELSSIFDQLGSALGEVVSKLANR